MWSGKDEHLYLIFSKMNLKLSPKKSRHST